MGKTFFFENIDILMGSKNEVIKDNLLIIEGKIKAFGNEAKKEAFSDFKEPRMPLSQISLQDVL